MTVAEFEGVDTLYKEIVAHVGISTVPNVWISGVRALVLRRSLLSTVVEVPSDVAVHDVGISRAAIEDGLAEALQQAGITLFGLAFPEDATDSRPQRLASSSTSTPSPSSSGVPFASSSAHAATSLAAPTNPPIPPTTSLSPAAITTPSVAAVPQPVNLAADSPAEDSSSSPDLRVSLGSAISGTVIAVIAYRQWRSRRSLPESGKGDLEVIIVTEPGHASPTPPRDMLWHPTSAGPELWAERLRESAETVGAEGEGVEGGGPPGTERRAADSATGAKAMEAASTAAALTPTMATVRARLVGAMAGRWARGPKTQRRWSEAVMTPRGLVLWHHELNPLAGAAGVDAVTLPAAPAECGARHF
eukprot:307010-Rhodomonas_salina.1